MPPGRKNQKISLNEVSKKIDLHNSQSYNEHEDDHHSSSAYGDNALIFKPQDIKQKMMIAYNITLQCKEMKGKLLSGNAQEIKIAPILKRLNEYTNLPVSELKPIYDNVIARDRSFAKTMRHIRNIPEPTAGLLADDIRSIFIKFVIEKKHFPSKIDVLKDLKVLSNQYSNENIPIPRLVKNKLIKYQHFPEFNRYFLTEHPEKVYHRTVYLNSMKTLRSQQRNFVYVEVRRIIPRGTACGFIAGLAAFPSSGKLEKFFTKDSVDPIAKKWMQQRILPIVPEGSVVVLAQPKARTKLTPMSKRFDFITWLDQKGIPYGKNPHTAELYGLYTKFKGITSQEGVYDHVFLNAGLTLVHFPTEWRILNFFNFIWADISVMDSYHPGRPEFLKQKILNATASLLKPNEPEESLIEEELKMMKEDSILEEIIENVYEMVKRGEVQTLEFPKECSGDKTDYFEMNLSDFFFDITCE